MDREKVIGHLNDCMEAVRRDNTWVFVRKDIVEDAIAMLKEQDEQKRRWLQCIADNQLANSPTYGKDDNVAYWHKRGIWDGLQMAYEILTEEK